VAFILAVVIGLFFMFLIFVSFYIVLFTIWLLREAVIALWAPSAFRVWQAGLLREAVIALWAPSAFRVPVGVPPRAHG
jgi:hypothetical protein